MSIIVVRHVNNLQGKIVLFTSELKGRRWRNRLECQAEKLVNWYFNWLTDRYRLKDLASSWIMDQLLYSQSFSALRLSDDLQITLHRQQIPNPNTLSKSRKHENLEYVIEGLRLSFCNECEEKNWTEIFFKFKRICLDQVWYNSIGMRAWFDCFSQRRTVVHLWFFPQSTHGIEIRTQGRTSSRCAS